MQNQSKLLIIKIAHTVIWIFFNVVIFYMLYAALPAKLDRSLWIGYGLFALEAFVLLTFKFFCPLTIMARRYSKSQKSNFDIFIPDWIARYNKRIYSTLLLAIALITIFLLISKA